MRKLLLSLMGSLWLWTGAVSAQELSCENWCGLLAANCPEEILHDQEFCLSYCEHPYLEIVPTGSPGDTTGNSLACRIDHAEAAALTSGSTREAHCAAAAMSGGNTCGSFCDVYCDVAMQTCNQTENPLYPGTELFVVGGSPNIGACRAACRDYPEDVLDGISQTDQLFGYGDSVQCRLHHLQAAVVEGRGQTSAYGLHCGHAGPEAADGLCSNSVEPNVINYCVFALYHCQGDDALFAEGTEQTDCMSEMNLLINDGVYGEDGFESFADESTNSVGCFNNRIMLAALDAATYCAAGNADPDEWVPQGAAVCVASEAALPMGREIPLVLAGLLAALGLIVLWAEVKRKHPAAP